LHGLQNKIIYVLIIIIINCNNMKNTSHCHCLLNLIQNHFSSNCSSAG